MNDHFTSLIEQAQSDEIVTSYGGELEQSLNPRIVIAAYRIGAAILSHPIF